MAFPALTVNPSQAFDETFEDATIRSPFEAGYDHARPRYTRTRRTFRVTYNNMPKADRDTLTTFITTVREGADAFNWTHPEAGGATYSVRFIELPKFTHTVLTFWSCEFTIRVV